MNFQILNGVRLTLVLCSLSAAMLTACSRGPVPVSIHGVNYSKDPFSYVVEDPGDKENMGGGELVDSYAAGGTMCCYELPPRWHPGTKVRITTKQWIGESADTKLKEVPSTVLTDVPRYPGDKPGELWIIRRSDGNLELVVSDLQPDHKNWPGATKGWPVPSVEFQRRIWDIHISNAQGSILAFESLKDELRSSPDEAARKEWEQSEKYDRKSLDGFAGPRDPRYRAKLTTETKEMLVRFRAELLRLQKERP